LIPSTTNKANKQKNQHQTLVLAWVVMRKGTVMKEFSSTVLGKSAGYSTDCHIKKHGLKMTGVN
jgi:hypothetical protein